MKGIKNIGNSCYMNSALQLLFNSYDLCILINTNKSYELINKINLNIIKYYSVVSQNTNVEKYFNPTEIKNIIDLNTNMFSGSLQQDSSEFITFFFDIIDKSCHKMLYKMFGIQTNINIKCKMPSCLHTSSHIENDLLLHLNCSPSLSDSYRLYKTDEILENENAFQCNGCNNKTQARKRIEITKWPNNLIIVLKRFNHMMKKNNNDVIIPLKWRHGYELQGGIIHIGNFHGGHYIYYGLNKIINKWVIVNDSNISVIEDMDMFLQKYIYKSYILYYVKNEITLV